MKTLILCQNCERYYCFYADDNTIISQGCELDLPHYSRKPVECCSYREVVR